MADAPEGFEFLERMRGKDLTSGYDGAVKQADTLADRMREAAEKVERVAMLDVQIAAWEERRNAEGGTVNWRFTTQDARIKLKRLYPSLQVALTSFRIFSSKPEVL